MSSTDVENSSNKINEPNPNKKKSETKPRQTGKNRAKTEKLSQN